MTKPQNRSTEQLLALWDSLSTDQRSALIDSDDLTAAEIIRLDQLRPLTWAPLTL